MIDGSTLITNVVYPLAVSAGLVFFVVLLLRNRHRSGHWAADIIAYCKLHPISAFMMVCSIGLSAASFWTTFGGMQEFVANPLISFFITLGIQGIMLAFAFKLSFDLFESSSGKTGTLAVVSFLGYCASLTASSFFSTAMMFDIVFRGPDREQWANANAGVEVSEVLSTLDRRMLRARSDVFDPDQEAAWVSLRESVSALGAQVQTIVEQLRAEEEAAAQRRLDQQAAELTQLGDYRALEREVLASQRSLASDRSELARVETELAAWNAEYGEDYERIQVLDTQIEQEIAGELGDRPRGCGPVCRELQAERNALRAPLENGPLQRREILTRSKDRLEPAIAMQEAQLAQRLNDLGLAEAGLRQAGIDFEPNVQIDRSQIAPVDLEDAASPASARGLIDDGPDQDLLAVLTQATSREGLAAMISDFQRAPTEQRFEAIRRICAAVEAQTAAATTCNLARVEPAAQDAIALHQGRQFFEANCRLDETATATRSPAELTGTALQCISRSGLEPGAVSDLRSTILSVQRTRTEDAHAFSLILTALTDREALAWTALVIAVLIDILILLSSIAAVMVRTDVMENAGLSRREAAFLRVTLDTLPGHSVVRTASFLSRIANQPTPPGAPLNFSGVKLANVHPDFKAWTRSMLVALGGTTEHSFYSTPGWAVLQAGIALSALMLGLLIGWPDPLIAGAVALVATLVILRLWGARQQRLAEARKTGSSALVWIAPADNAAVGAAEPADHNGQRVESALQENQLFAISPRLAGALKLLVQSEQAASRKTAEAADSSDGPAPNDDSAKTAPAE